MSGKKNPIFFSHSFDEIVPSWSDKSDKTIAMWFEDELKKRWKVTSGKPNQAQPIGDKVIEAIDESLATFALFTRKTKIEGSDERYTTSPWVLCECSYALGRFRQAKYIVAGFREKGVEPTSLGMLTVDGMEIPEFDRNDLESSRKNLQKYLADLENRISRGEPGQQSFTDSYEQLELTKIFIIYRNGFGTTQNIITCKIKDAEAFYQQDKGVLHHRIWSFQENLPSFADMMKVSVDQRKSSAFFNARLEDQPHRNINAKLSIKKLSRDEKALNFSVQFVDENNRLFKLKNNDIIRYQYAWGMPNMYKVFEEELENPDGDKIDSSSYNLAEVQANYGKINKMNLELRFERGATYEKNLELFSKRPFYKESHSFSGDKWSDSQSFANSLDYPDEHKMWYEVYKLTKTNFLGKLRIAWRPKSK
jgi:hypothetical protein